MSWRCRKTGWRCKKWQWEGSWQQSCTSVCWLCKPTHSDQTYLDIDKNCWICDGHHAGQRVKRSPRHRPIMEFVVGGIQLQFTHLSPWLSLSTWGKTPRHSFNSLTFHLDLSSIHDSQSQPPHSFRKGFRLVKRDTVRLELDLKTKRAVN
jgi:hypothetical protein